MLLRFNLKREDLIESYLQASLLRNRYLLAISTPLDFITSLSTIMKLSFNIEEVAGAIVTIAECADLAELKDLSAELRKIEGLKFSAWALGVLIGSSMHWDSNAENDLLVDFKPPVLIDIQLSKHKIPIIGVGGGSFSSRFSARYVLNSCRQLKRALFIRKTNQLSNTLDMALVSLIVNDIIVTVSGTKPFSLENPDIEISALKVVLIKETQAECIDISDRLDASFLPESVIIGAQKYNNRKGDFFCSGLTNPKDISQGGFNNGERS